MRIKDMVIGDKVIYRSNDFDGSTDVLATIVEVAEDHALAICDGLQGWDRDVKLRIEPDFNESNFTFVKHA